MGTEISCKTFKRFNNAEEHYSVPDGIIRIDDLAFADSDRLVSLTIPESVDEIGNYAFANCYSLREIKMPASVKRIGAGLFQKCWNVRAVALPEGMTTLGNDMFEGCHALYSLCLPGSLESVERTAFSSCRSLRNVYIDPDRFDLLPVSARYLAALTYMEEHMPDEGCTTVDEYVSGRVKSILDLAVNRKSAEAVRYMLGRGLVTDDTLNIYLSKSVNSGRVEITAMLLDYSKDVRNCSIEEDPFI